LVAEENSFLGQVAENIDQEKQEGKKREQKVVGELGSTAKDPILFDPPYETFEAQALKSRVQIFLLLNERARTAPPRI
jgi:hypothetical protein